MRTLHLTLAAAALTLVACGGSVAVSGTGGGSSGSTGGGAGGGIGGTGGGGTGGGPTTCQRTYDGFSYLLRSKDPSAKALDCGGMEPGGSAIVHLEGVITAHADNTYTIDTCPPSADCDIASVYDLTVSAPGMYFDLPVGAFAQIDVDIEFPWGCQNTLLVRNLPVWDNTPSPYGSYPTLFLAGSEGSPTTLPGSPFTITTTALGCYPPTSQGCGQEDDYRFDVGGNTGLVEVYQGESRFISVDGQPPLLFHNLRSFETGWCDDYWNWAYWVTPAPIPD